MCRGREQRDHGGAELPDNFIDPNWPPPVPNSPVAEHLSAVNDPNRLGNYVDPSWPAPNPSARFGDEPPHEDPSFSGWRTPRGRLIVIAVAGAVGLGVGAILVFGLMSSGGEPSPSDSPLGATSAPSQLEPPEMPSGSIPTQAPKPVPTTAGTFCVGAERRNRSHSANAIRPSALRSRSGSGGMSIVGTRGPR